MKEFAAIWGLKLYEEFKVEEHKGIYRITERCIEAWDSTAGKWQETFLYKELLTGDYDIIKRCCAAQIIRRYLK